MSTQAEIHALFGEALAPLGFERKTFSWYRTRKATYSVVRTTKCEWGAKYFVDVGLALSADLDRPWLSENKCPVSFRVEALKAVDCDAVIALSDEAVAELGESEWRRTVSEGVCLPLAQALDPVEDLDDLRAFIKNDLTTNIFLHKEIRGRLGL